MWLVVVVLVLSLSAVILLPVDAFLMQRPRASWPLQTSHRHQFTLSCGPRLAQTEVGGAINLQWVMAMAMVMILCQEQARSGRWYLARIRATQVFRTILTGKWEGTR